MMQQLRSALAGTLAALKLEPAPYQRFAGGTMPLRRAILLVLVVGLLVGGVQALAHLSTLTQPPVFDEQAFLQQLEQGLATNQLFGPQPGPEAEAMLDAIRSSVEAFAPQINKILAVPAPFPSWVGRLFAWLGIWLSTPFSLLARWLGLSLWIMLFARMIGGRGTLLSYLGASSLSVLPQALRAFEFLPVLGSLLVLLAGLWGLAMQVRAVQVTHHLSQSRAIAAVLLPYLLVLAALILFGSLAFIGLILALATGN